MANDGRGLVEEAVLEYLKRLQGPKTLVSCHDDRAASGDSAGGRPAVRVDCCQLHRTLWVRDVAIYTRSDGDVDVGGCPGLVIETRQMGGTATVFLCLRF